MYFFEIILCCFTNIHNSYSFRSPEQVLAAVSVLSLAVKAGALLCYQMILQGIKAVNGPNFENHGKYFIRHQLTIHEINFP